MNIREIILNAMETDDSFSLSDQQKLINRYSKLSGTEMKAVDDIMISLTGYSLGNLINKLQNDEVEESKETKLADRIVKLAEELKIQTTALGKVASFDYSSEEEYEKKIAELKKEHKFDDSEVITKKSFSGKMSAIVPLKEE